MTIQEIKQIRDKAIMDSIIKRIEKLMEIDDKESSFAIQEFLNEIEETIKN